MRLAILARCGATQLLLSTALAMSVMPVQAQESEIPYKLYLATIVDIIDGDNLAVSVKLWPGLVAEYSVRVRGIDAPEIRRAGCAEEKSWGDDAKEQLEKLYDIGTEVRVENVEYDSFSGRVVADVSRKRSDRWLDLKKEMIDRKMAVAWVPTDDDVPWCLLAKTR